MIGLLQRFSEPPVLRCEEKKAKNSVDNPLLCLILQAGQNREVVMNTLSISAGLFLFAFTSLAFSQPANIYYFSGDVDLGVDFTLFQSSGQHYIGAKGDTVYVVTSNGWTWCSKSTDGGRTFGWPPVRVNSTAEAYNPSMRVDTAGVVYVAYQDEYADIRFTKSTDGGVSFTPGIKVNDDTIPETGQEMPVININNKGQIFVAWQDQRNIPRPGRTVFTATSFDGGLSFTPNVQVSEPGTTAGGPDIAADDSGKVYAIYVGTTSGQRGIVFARSNDSGQSYSHYTLANDPPWSGGSPSLAIFPPHIGVVWPASRVVGDSLEITIRFSTSGDYGQTFFPSVRVDDDTTADFKLSVLQASLFIHRDTFFVSWTEERLGRFRDVLFSYSADTGRTFAPSKQANSDTLTVAGSPSLALNEGGKAFVVWLDPRRDPLFGENWHPFVSVGYPFHLKGDLNLDWLLSATDVVTLINAVFLNLPFPAPFENADANCDGILRPADVVLELLAVFLYEPFPC
ncbi:MAG TPA: sialidase family protein [Verrucomicrobiae bacterium]|nr:sialidase family protein [Verrucomicrobiae bacterium]